MKTIMLVDDNPTLVMLYSEVLRRNGYAVRTALSGKECLDILRESSPDLILLDIMMEPMDGWEVLTEIRSGNSTKTIPVMVLSAKYPQYDEISSHSPHIDGYVMKPVTHESLIRIVGDFFRFRDYLDTLVTRAEERGADEATIRESVALLRHWRMVEMFRSILGPDLGREVSMDPEQMERFNVLKKILAGHGITIDEAGLRIES